MISIFKSILHFYLCHSLYKDNSDDYLTPARNRYKYNKQLTTRQDKPAIHITLSLFRRQPKTSCSSNR